MQNDRYFVILRSVKQYSCATNFASLVDNGQCLLFYNRLIVPVLNIDSYIYQSTIAAAIRRENTSIRQESLWIVLINGKIISSVTENSQNRKEL